MISGPNIPPSALEEMTGILDVWVTEEPETQRENPSGEAQKWGWLLFRKLIYNELQTGFSDVDIGPFWSSPLQECASLEQAGPEAGTRLGDLSSSSSTLESFSTAHQRGRPTE